MTRLGRSRRRRGQPTHQASGHCAWLPACHQTWCEMTSIAQPHPTAAGGSAGPTVRAVVALLTETAAGYFERFGFRPVDRGQLPAGRSSR